MAHQFDKEAAAAFLKNAAGMIGKDKESPIRHVLSAGLADMYPGKEKPWWVTWHARGSEKTIVSDVNGGAKRGFIDTLVGSTAIEYEKDLTNAGLFSHGEDQVREYCAGLINDGVPTDLVVGILSDTIRWHAYRVADLTPLEPGQLLYGAGHLRLEEIERIDLSLAGEAQATELDRFLSVHLGRVGGRVLAADTLAFDLGFESSFCANHLAEIQAVVDHAFGANPEYARLISKVWSDFVSYLGGSGVGGDFDRATYVSELYVLTLAKLLCANVLEGRALLSDDDEMDAILEGGFFQSRGFSNLVEYDYFGWLNEADYVKNLRPIAGMIQRDLAAYDFTSPPSEDLFGAVMAQLARRSQRILLGQEWTPAWLARRLVRAVADRLPQNEFPSFIDMCCGSGSMVVETVKLAIEKLRDAGALPDRESTSRLAQAITGFDIDPLAVMLAKVSWVLAAKPWLDEAGTFDVSIPIYHADSLFASTPVSKTTDVKGGEHHELDLDGLHLSLPSFLLSGDLATLFDALLSDAYGVAMDAARSAPSSSLPGMADDIVRNGMQKADLTLDDSQRESATAFVASLLSALEDLQRAGRNGIWAFVLGNSYRPGLVAGRFNGLVSNPPWLAMSKVANNPYKVAMEKISEKHGIKPTGSSHLHAELATIFLLHAVSHYLKNGAVVGCILPESVTSAHHHNPFRLGEFRNAQQPVPFLADEIWWVEKGTFKNEAIVLFGHKTAASASATLKGKSASASVLTTSAVHVLTQGARTVWSSTPAASTAIGFFSPAPFRQGADVFPRTAIFHTIVAAGTRVNLSPIQRPNGPLTYLVKDAKNHKAFSIVANGVDPLYLFDVLMSNHLTAFAVTPPAKGFLPLTNAGDEWAPVPETALRASGAATANAFKRFFSVAGGTSQAFFDAIDTPRKKLRAQRFSQNGYLVVMGAGGGIVCAGYLDMSELDPDRLIIDQTLYWAVVPTEDEALYLTGALNSEAINTVIGQFQPRGQFGARHVHKLPLGATPPYDPLDAAHADVVAATRDLLAEYVRDQAREPGVFTALLDPNRNLPSRRRALRERFKNYGTYPAYHLATRSLYAV
jgi:hypothetical protein